MATAAQLPGLERLDACFRATSPVFRDVVARNRDALGPEWCRSLDETVTRLFPGDAELAAAVEGYARFALDIVRRTMKFEKERAYPARTYAEVARDVYGDAAYMRTRYLPGLLLSHELWPHHHRQRRFFEEAFVSDLRRAGTGPFYDVGVGTGFYSRVALAGAPEARGIGFDVSPASRDYAEWHVAAFGAGERYRVELRDVLADPPPPVPRVVCVEVLEHLEDPLAFARGLRRLLAPGGKAFVTAAINAPNADHIYLYRSAEEVKAQLVEAGFVVEQYLAALAGPPSRPGAPVAEVAAFVLT
jgi:SAM-dependent methyltransferase